MRYAAAICVAQLAAAGLLLSPSAAANLQRFEYTQPHMGTTARIVVFGDERGRVDRAAGAAFGRIADLDRRLTDYREDSELMRACREAAYHETPLSDDVFRVVDAAQTLAVRTGGAFDVTTGPLTRLWRRARRQGEMPDPHEWASARDLVSYRRMHVSRERRAIRLDKTGMRLDVGGIAKGYAADVALEMLRTYGYTRAMVVVGGEVAVSDPPPDQRGWRVTLAPLGRITPPTSQLLISHSGVSTSGDAEQWVDIDGVRYSHVLDPRTGMPLVHRTSVTILARNAMTSDMLATAVSVLGPRHGLALADSTPGAAGLMGVEMDNAVHWSSSRRWPAASAAVARR